MRQRRVIHGHYVQVVDHCKGMTGMTKQTKSYEKFIVKLTGPKTGGGVAKPLQTRINEICSDDFNGLMRQLNQN